jgi:2'-5' RNA ligase
MLGFPAENRPFSAHLTLGRVDQRATKSDLDAIAEVIRNQPTSNLGTTRVSAVHLYQSILQPQGAQYTRLFSANLLPFQER